VPQVCQQGRTGARSIGLDGTEEAEQVVGVDLLVVPEAHVAARWADGGYGVGHEGGHLLHVLGVHMLAGTRAISRSRSRKRKEAFRGPFRKRTIEHVRDGSVFGGA
jgi:hypothetical protein